MNQDFQELKRQYSIQIKNHIQPITDQMRKNLIDRNNGNVIYTFNYTTKGKTLSIETCNIEGLLAIDGDMNPLEL